jgi:hypothetical protein
MRSIVINISILLSCFSIKGQIPLVYNNYVDFSLKNSSPNFKLIKLDTVFVYEIVRMNGENLQNGCRKFSYFSIKPIYEPIDKHLEKHSFVFFGEYYESLRPSNYNTTAIKKYDIQNIVNHIGDSLAYKIDDNQYFKVFKTHAIIQKYNCNSKDWYKYYFPLKKSIKSKFKYYEIIKVLNRTEVTDEIQIKSKRVPFFCNLHSN